MSTMLFGLETWGRIGAAAVLARHATGRRQWLPTVIAEVLTDMQIAVESNRRAFSARYQGRYDDEIEVFTDADLRQAIGGVLCALPAPPPREWFGVGGGIAYNCSEDPQYVASQGALKRLDDAIDSQ